MFPSHMPSASAISLALVHLFWLSSMNPSSHATSRLHLSPFGGKHDSTRFYHRVSSFFCFALLHLTTLTRRRMGIALAPIGIGCSIGPPIAGAVLGPEYHWWKVIVLSSVRTAPSFGPRC